MSQSKPPGSQPSSNWFHNEMSRRSFLVSGGVVVTAAVLAGCGSKPSAPSGAPGGGGAPSAGPVTLKYVNLGDSNMNLWPQFLADLEKQSSIKVQVDNFPFGEAHDKFVTLATGNQLPDYAYGLAEWIGEFVERGILVSPEDLFGAGIKDKYIAATLPPSTYNGKLWALPLYYSVRALYSRPDWLGDAGVTKLDTWDDVLNAAKRVHKLPDRIGFGMPASRHKNTVEYFLQCFWPFGGELLSDDNKQVRFNEQAGVDALTFWVELSKYAQPGLVNHKNDEVEAAFREGRVALTTNGPWIGGAIEKDKLNVKYAVSLPPQAKKRVALAVEDVLLIFKGKHTDAVKQAVDQIYQDKVHLELDKTYNFVPVTKTEGDNQYYKDSKLMNAFMQAAPFGRFRPGIPAWSKINDLLAVAIQKAISGQATPKAALDEAAQEATAALQS